jgi:transcriptional regulator with XRE-family HTH domain
MNDKLRAAIGRRIAQIRDQRGLTLIQVADAAKCDEATVRNAIAGRALRQKSLAAICRALDIDLADFALGEAGELTQRIYGYERRNEVRHYEGFYLLYYYNLLDHQNLFCSAVRVAWDDADRALAVEEYTRFRQDGSTPFDGVMNGHLYINEEIGFAQILLNAAGMLQLITASRLERGGRQMFGAMLTQVSDFIQYRPITSPVVLERVPEQSDFKAVCRLSRLINPADPAFDQISPTLRQIEMRISAAPGRSSA